MCSGDIAAIHKIFRFIEGNGVTVMTNQYAVDVSKPADALKLGVAGCEVVGLQGAQTLQAERLHVVARHHAAANHRLLERVEGDRFLVFLGQRADQATRETVAPRRSDRAGWPAGTPGN